MAFLMDEDDQAKTRTTQADGKGRQAIRQPHAKRKQLIVEGVRGCDACPLRERWDEIETPRMEATTTADDPDILVLGEAPGRNEDERGEIFVGKTGSFLRDMIPAKWDSRLVYQNTVRCRPKDNRTPTPKEVYQCSKYLEDDVDRYNVKAILAVGGTPMDALLGRDLKRTSILLDHGVPYPVRLGGRVLWAYSIFHPSYVMRLKGKFDEGPVYPVWKADIRNFFRDVDSWPKPRIWKFDPKNVIIPQNREEAAALRDKMRGPIAVDIETANTLRKDPKAGLRPYNKGSLILSASLSDGEVTMAFSVDHPQGPNPWGMEFLLETVETRHWVAHNAAYELAWLIYFHAVHNRTREIHLFEDTMALARLYFKRETIQGLDIVSRIVLGTNVKALSNLNTERMLSYTLNETLTYNGLDSMATAPIYHELVKKVNKTHYEALLERIESFTMMQLYGLHVDAQAAKDEVKYWEDLADEHAQKANELYEVRQYERAHGEFNIGSPKDVGNALVEFGKLDLPKTDGGKQFNTKDEVLQEFAADHPLVKVVLDWRDAGKNKGTYALPMLVIPTQTTDGLMHPCYSALKVATFRSSSEDPNAQNWPSRRNRRLRKPIVAPEGHVLVAFDYGQLQVRVVAMAAKDAALIHDLVTGKDIHSYWLNKLLDAEPHYLERLARETNETEEAKIRKAGRNIIKSDFVFASLFGATAHSVAHRTNIDFDLIAGLQSDFWSEYRATEKWIKRQHKYYQEHGEVVGLSGLIRHSILWINEPINTPIQCGEADIVLSAQAALSRRSIQEGDFALHPRINVHDDLTFILPDDDTDTLADYIETIAAEMTRIRFDWQICPLTVEVKVGQNWADMKQLDGLFTGDYVR